MPIDEGLDDLNEPDVPQGLIDIIDLKQKIRKTDFSINNPKTQKIFENAIEHWCKIYEKKQDPKDTLTDCYGNHRIYKEKQDPKDILTNGYGDPKNIPDWIFFGKGFYSPTKILYHVKHKDEVGIAILNIMQEFRDNYFITKNIKKTLFDGVSENNLDDFAMFCVCGSHKLTHRQVVEGVIKMDSDSPVLYGGLVDAIKSLYVESKDANR
jgi:hypothetical protein